jgi:hypothetical protein
MITYHPNKKSVLVYLDEKIVKECRERGVSFCKFKKWGDKAPAETKDWRKGILNDKDDPSQAERIGQYGEVAFSMFSGIEVDKEVKDKGNKFDFSMKDGKLIEVKTNKVVYKDATKSKGYYGPFFIKAIDERGRKLPLKSDFFIFTSIYEHNGKVNKGSYRSEIDATWIVIEIHGIITKEQLLKNAEERLAPALKGSHQNYYISEEELMSPASFLCDYGHVLNLGKACIFV